MHCASVALKYNVAKDSLLSGKGVIPYALEFLLQWYEPWKMETHQLSKRRRERGRGKRAGGIGEIGGRERKREGEEGKEQTIRSSSSSRAHLSGQAWSERG